ncbi:MAG: cupredoxin domain-containing protein [Endomicrobiia bacterium]
MKKINEIVAVVLVVISTIGIIFGIFTIEKLRKSRLYTVELIAREPNHGNWYPRKFKVPYGKKVRILIRNIETVSHGFALPDFNVGVSEIKAGEVAVVEFIADKKGVFPFMCTIWCSERHMEMTGEIVVE